MLNTMNLLSRTVKPTWKQFFKSWHESTKPFPQMPWYITIKLNKCPQRNRKRMKILFSFWVTQFFITTSVFFHSPAFALTSPTLKMAKAINLFNLSFSRHYLSALCSLPSIFISNNTRTRLFASPFYSRVEFVMLNSKFQQWYKIENDLNKINLALSCAR